MSRIRKILGTDKKQGDEQSRKKDGLTAKRGESEQLIVNTIDILDENEELYNQAKQALRDDEHERCIEILNYFIENDLALRRIIANENNENPSYALLSTKVIIELQSYYNFF